MSRDRAKKTTVVQRENRALEVYDLLLKEMTRPQILEHCSKKWNLRRAASDTLISEASKMIKSDIEATRYKRLSKLLDKQESLYDSILEDRPITKEGVGIPNYETARKLLMDHAKLLGLDQQVINHVVEDKRELEAMTDEQLDAILLEDENH